MIKFANMKVKGIHYFLISRLCSHKKIQHLKWGCFCGCLFSQIYCCRNDSKNKTLTKITSIQNIYSVKPSHVATSIKQSPVLKGQFFLVLSYKTFILIKPLLRGHLSYKATFSWSPWWSFNTGLILYSIKLRLEHSIVQKTPRS